MSKYYYARNHRSNNYRNYGPKFIQILPCQRPVTAVYRNEDGSECREPVDLLGLDSTGGVSFLSMSPEGVCDVPDQVGNFVRYEFG